MKILRFLHEALLFVVFWPLAIVLGSWYSQDDTILGDMDE